MGSGKWIVPACILTFCACAVAAWFSHQQGAAYLFLGIVGFFLVLVGYGRYRQTITRDSGPVDPSHNWQAVGGSRAGEVGSFRYSQGALTIVRVFAWVSTLVTPAIYGVSSPHPTGADLIGLVIFGVGFFTCFYVGLIACKAYSVVIQAKAVVIRGLLRSRTYNFSSLGMVALLESGGRGSKYVLAMYDKANRALYQIGDGVDNFDQLVALMKKRSFEEGIPYRYRDMWGCWTK